MYLNQKYLVEQENLTSEENLWVRFLQGQIFEMIHRIQRAT